MAVNLFGGLEGTSEADLPWIAAKLEDMFDDGRAALLDRLEQEVGSAAIRCLTVSEGNIYGAPVGKYLYKEDVVSFITNFKKDLSQEDTKKQDNNN